MIAIFRQNVFYGSVLLSLMGIVMMLAKIEGTHPSGEFRTAMLSLILLLGVILIIVIAKSGLRD